MMLSFLSQFRLRLAMPLAALALGSQAGAQVTEAPGPLSAAAAQALADAAKLDTQLLPPRFGALPASKPAEGFTVHYTSKYPSADAAVAAAKPGDAVVFDSKDKAPIVVKKPLRDVQFIGGEAEWDLQADVTDCAFLWHGLMRFTQHSGKLQTTVFYRSTGQRTSLTHVDGVTFYYCGEHLLWPAHNPDKGRTVQFQVNGFVRGLTIHKPISGYAGINKTFDMDWAPALQVDATDPVGNGYGTYVISPILWAQRAWTPYLFVRGTGMTFAHVNTEYNIWADPIVETLQTVDFTVLCSGVGAHGEANNNAYTAPPARLKYARGEELGHGDQSNAPFRGAAFTLGGQRSKAVALGNYKGWYIGRKQWLPGMHYASGTIARDPYFQEWVGHSGELTANFSDFKNVSLMKKKGFQHDTAPHFEKQTYPLLGANIVRPTLIPLPDIRAWLPTVRDFTGKSGDEIATTLEAADPKKKEEATIYLGPGTYQFTRTLKRGRILGAGMDRTILVWPAEIDCAQRAFDGFRNLTVKGGRFGVNYQVGEGGSQIQDPNDFVRVRFEGQAETCINIHATQNQIYQDCEFVGAKNGFGWNLDPAGVWKGENGPKGLNIDKLDLTNCTFRNIKERAIDLRPNPQPNGQVAIHNCLFENIGGEAIYLRGGQSHLVQNIRVVKAGTKGGALSLLDLGSRGALAVSHITIENSGVSGEHTGIAFNGDGVTSHCTIRGVKTALKTSKVHALDHVITDGTIDVGSGSYIALSEGANVKAGRGVVFAKGDGTFIDVTGKAGVQPLDTTPPPVVGGVKTEPKGTGTLVTWAPVEDPESGVAEYAVFRAGAEIARTTISYVPPENFHSPFVRMEKPTSLLVEGPAEGLTVKAINGAGLLSGGGPAAMRRWSPVRGQFLRKDGSVLDLNSDVSIPKPAKAGDPLVIVLPDGTRLDPATDLQNNTNPSRILLAPGPLLEPSTAKTPAP